jgi:DUF438 domain-containing protein
MQAAQWFREFPASITICDKDGTILDMNTAATSTFAREGGGALIGTNVLDCHPEPARSKLEHLLRSGASNCYTIEKEGKRKLIYQAPWYEEGRYKGVVEISIALPETIPHFVRDPAV